MNKVNPFILCNNTLTFLQMVKFALQFKVTLIQDSREVLKSYIAVI